MNDIFKKGMQQLFKIINNLYNCQKYLTLIQ